MDVGVTLQVRFAVDDVTVSALHDRAFGSTPTEVQPWATRLARHALSWVGAFDGDVLVGFVQLGWDGGAHAFLLDTAVDPAFQRRGVGRAVVEAAVAEATRAGCEWVHVDYEPHLMSFYRDACGFRPTDAGLRHLPPRAGTDRSGAHQAALTGTPSARTAWQARGGARPGRHLRGDVVPRRRR